MGLTLKQLEIYKFNLQNQANLLLKEKTEKEKQILMVKGAIMWVSQRISELKEEKRDSKKGSGNPSIRRIVQ